MESSNQVGNWIRQWAERYNILCHYQYEIDSTNALAKREMENAATPSVFVAETQTKGRGRGQNQWINSLPGSSMLITWLFKLERPAQPIITPLAGLAMYHSLKTTLGVRDLSLKAPNDLLVSGKKVCGLLVEAVSQGHNHHLLVGIGLNVFSKPNLEDAGEIASVAAEKISSELWELFMNTLMDELQRSVQLCTEDELPASACQELLSVLNLNPNLKEKYLEVMRDGTLRTTSRTIHWSEL